MWFSKKRLGAWTLAAAVLAVSGSAAAEIKLAEANGWSVSTDGRVAALDPRTGAVQGYTRIGSPAVISPIAVNGTVYVVTDKAELVAIR